MIGFVNELLSRCLVSSGHVTENEMEYFVKWFRLLMLEAREDVISNGRKQVWTETSKERETNGKCFKEMVIQKETKTSISCVLQSSFTGWQLGLLQRGFNISVISS